MREKYVSFAQSVLLSLYIFLGKGVSQSCFFGIIVNFIIQKLKSKHTSLKKTFFSRFEGTRGEKPPNISNLSDYLGNTDDAQRIYYLKHYINQLLKGTYST